jgi:hypothetical protein
VLLVGSEQERQRVAAQAHAGQRIVVLKPEPAPDIPQQRERSVSTMTVRQAATRTLGLDRM